MKASSRKRNIIIVIALAIINSLIMIAIPGVEQSEDSSTYIAAWQNIRAGIPDIDRTPVYPAFIAMAGAVAGEGGKLLLTVIMQHVLSWAALWCFYLLTVRVTRSERAAFWLSVLMVLLPAMTLWNNYILTESLAASGSIFLVWSLIAIYDGKSRWHELAVFFWLAFLIFLRPALIYLLPVLLVAFIIMWWQKRQYAKRALAGIVAVVAVSVALLAYMKAFQRQYGVFAITRVSTFNNYFLMRQSGTLDPQKTDDKDLRAFLEQSYKEKGRGINTVGYFDLMDETGYVVKERWSLPTVSQLIADSRHEQPLVQAENQVRRIYVAGTEPLLEADDISPFNLVDITLGWVYVLLAVYAVTICVRARRTGRLDWSDALMLMMGASNVIVSLVGAMGEFSRLIFPSKFIYLIMASQLLLLAFRKARS